MTRKEIKKLLKEKFDNDMISNTEYVHYEMIINEILGTNIHRNVNKRNTISWIKITTKQLERYTNLH